MKKLMDDINDFYDRNEGEVAITISTLALNDDDKVIGFVANWGDPELIRINNKIIVNDLEEEGHITKKRFSGLISTYIQLTIGLIVGLLIGFLLMM